MDVHAARRSLDGSWSAPLPAWDSPQTLVTVFGPSSLAQDPAPLADVLAAFPTSLVVGCSTSGEILGDTVADDTVTVAVARFATTRLALVHAEVAATADSRSLGAALAADLVAALPDAVAGLVLSDGLAVNGSELSEGLIAGTGGSVPFSGGLAGDGDRFRSTWVLVDGVPRPGVVAVVGLAGPDLEVGHGSRGGWDIFGPERRVTRSVGNVLFEVDGHPALELYKRYLGDRAEGLPSTALLFPLAVRLDDSTGWVVRTVLAVDEEQQSLTFAGDVPQGAISQLMRASVDRLVDGAVEAAGDAVGAPGGPVLAVAVSCVGRRLVMGRRTEDELDAVQAVLPPGSALAGFYSYGELSPLDGGPCRLHNQTMTVTTLRETVTAAT
jgi:hypothetical protein